MDRFEFNVMDEYYRVRRVNEVRFNDRELCERVSSSFSEHVDPDDVQIIVEWFYNYRDEHDSITPVTGSSQYNGPKKQSKMNLLCRKPVRSFIFKSEVL